MKKTILIFSVFFLFINWSHAGLVIAYCNPPNCTSHPGQCKWILEDDQGNDAGSYWGDCPKGILAPDKDGYYDLTQSPKFQGVISMINNSSTKGINIDVKHVKIIFREDLIETPKPKVEDAKNKTSIKKDLNKKK